MAAISVTYTFVNSTTADAAQVNQNYTDIINGTSDTTKDFSISALTCAGTATFNNAVTLGLSTANNITFTGVMASTLNVGTNNSYDIGSSTKGLAGVYLGTAGAFTTRLKSGATASWTLTFPVTAGSATQILSTDGSGNTSWISQARGPEARQNYAISTSVGSNAMTVNLLAADLTTPTATNFPTIGFRNATAATGDTTNVTVTSALSVVIPSGATLGQPNNTQFIYVWAMNNAGVIELCVSGSKEFDQGTVQSSTAISAGSTSSNVLYGTSGRSSKAIRLLGRIKAAEATSGTYASNSSEIALHSPNEKVERSEILLYTANGYGSVNTAVRRWTTVGKNLGTGMTLTQSATNGDSITINEPGIYSTSYIDQFNAGGTLAICINLVDAGTLTGGFSGTTPRAQILTGGANSVGMAGYGTSIVATTFLSVGDVITFVGNTPAGADAYIGEARITKVTS